MIGARRKTPEHKRSGLQTGKGQAASQDGPISDWQNADEWPLALLFPHEHLAQWSGAPAAFPAAMLHGLAVNLSLIHI